MLGMRIVLLSLRNKVFNAVNERQLISMPNLRLKTHNASSSLL